MKKIGIDARMAFSTGIGTYLRGVLGGMPRGRQKYAFTLFGDPARTTPLLPEASHESFHAKIYSLREQLQYPSKLRSCDLWHSPHYNAPFVKGKTRLVVTVHDLIHWIFRKDFFSPLQAFYAEQMFRNVVRQADHIIAVSRKTAEDLALYFGAKPHHISVVHEGVAGDFVPAKGTSAHEELRRRYHLPEKFFLYVGSLKPHKNILLLLETFRDLKRKKRIQASLVIIGKKDAKYAARFRAVEALQTDRDVIYLPGIMNGELPAFYQMAAALVHPSLYEGFGLTLLEAMACGTPVIAARAGSIPEVAGQAALLVDPYSQSEIGHAMMRIESEPSLTAKLREEGFKNLKSYTWDQAARRTLEVYEKVLGG